MNIKMPKSGAKLIIELAKPHVEKAIKNGDIETAKVFQSIISTVEMALELNTGIEFK